MKFTLALTTFIIAICIAVIPAMADPVTSIPGGTIVTMPVLNYFGPGPQVFGPSIIWSSTNAFNQGGSVFGYTGGYGFGGNGDWSLNMAGLNDSFDAYGVTDTMTFAFSTPVAGVGGFLNYVPYGQTAPPTVIAVYDSGMNLLESYSLTFLTGGGIDTGEFHGFLRNSADISYFTLTDNYIGIADLTITGSYTPPVIPEPGTILLLGTGLAVIGLAAWRRKANL
jgi:hypothetical protein